MKNAIRIFFILGCYIITACNKEGINLQQDFYPRCIWEMGSHNAFTDIIEFEGYLFCCFREADNHISYDGSIRIIKSRDRVNWESVALVKEEGFDLRDPKLSITPENNLMLIYGRRSDIYKLFPRSRVMLISRDDIINNKISFEAAKNISINNEEYYSHNYWVWRVRWINNKCYGIAYKNWGNPILVVSENGVEFTKLTVFQVDGNEGDICLLDDGRLLAVLRADNGLGFIGYSSDFNYDSWDWEESNVLIQCPYIFKINNQIFIATRSYSGTSICELDYKFLIEKISIPGVGDYAYPGIIENENELIMSYYDSPNGHANIYLVSIPTKLLTL